MSRATGAISAIRFGSASVVMIRKVTVLCPSLVTTLSWRSASAIQTMPVSDSRISARAAAVLPEDVAIEDCESHVAG